MNIFNRTSNAAPSGRHNSFKPLNKYFSKNPIRKTVIISVVLLTIVLLSGWQFMAKVKEVVTDDFNQQQLVLARHAAEQIKQHIQTVHKELLLLSLSPSVQYYEKSFLPKRMQIAFSSLRQEGAIAIRYIDSTGQQSYTVTDSRFDILQTDPEDMKYYQWAKDSVKRDAILASEVYPLPQGNDEQLLVMKIAVPVWQVSVDDSHPVATDKFAGSIVIVIDVTSLIQKLTEGIKSGKTGYAWVIDSNGTFLYHIEKNLIGRNAFEARKEKMSTISFARINEIQKKMMLTGKEGTSWYVSGWHRGKEGIIKKLIAYSPIVLSDLAETRIWSVAVVAPVSEVEGAIHGIQIRQFMMQGVLIFIILAGSLTVISLMVRWSSSLQQEVSRQTKELKKSEQRYRSLVENAEDIIFTIDREGNFASINRYGSKLLGRPEDQIIGHNIAEIFSWPTAEMLLQTIKEVYDIKRGRQVTHLIRVGEKEIWLNTNFRRLLDDAGNIYAILGISRNITERKKMEEQGYYTEKLASMGTLAAGVAHEINNPIAIILGFTDMLLEKTPPDSENHDILKTIEGQGYKAKKVVDNLLTFARTKEHTETTVDINKNITEVLTVLGNNLLVRKVSINALDLGQDLPPVKGDPDELQQVFLNIINNAVYAMKGGGMLSVSTRAVKEGKWIEIRITDTGSGIRKEHRKNIFDPLFTTKKVGDGTGLGLSVSYGIITRHRGTITFDTKTADESESPGTTFIITLPAMPDSKDPRGKNA
ncbi:MAG: PAS domain S-box protein [Nitrospirae bacterium]|nr:PAS domain S-box protein [Nitrospirota bacterium]